MERAATAPRHTGVVPRVAGAKRPHAVAVAPGLQTLTVLVADIVASTELRLSLGGQVADDQLERMLDLMEDSVVTAGGLVVKMLGDGVLATFGSATAAIVGGVALQRSVAADVGDAGPVRLRVGLACGDVASDGRDIQGVPIVEATRLCNSAEGGQVLVSATAAAVTHDRSAFELRSLGSRQLKGLPGPIEVLEVAWEPLAGERWTPFPAALARRGPAPMVGRRKELRAAQRAWEAARSGPGRVLVISGEAGIGKTRLAGAVADRVAAGGAGVLYGRCEQGLGAPYQPIIEALGAHVAAVSADVLRVQVAGVSGELARLLPDISARLSGVTGSGARAEGSRWALFDAVSQLVANIAEPAGLLLVLDDLQWSEPATLLLARHLGSAAIQ